MKMIYRSFSVRNSTTVAVSHLSILQSVGEREREGVGKTFIDQLLQPQDKQPCNCKPCWLKRHSRKSVLYCVGVVQELESRVCSFLVANL